MNPSHSANATESNAALITFLGYMAAVFLLAWFAHRRSAAKSFVGEYFLGSRSLGTWAMALTFAATAASGGSFMGFPSRIYTHGWVLGLWIASYMLVPLVAMALLGKQLNRMARRAGALTVPEVLRERFQSPTTGAVATLLLVLFMFFYLLAQFKAGSAILATLLNDVPMFHRSVARVNETLAGLPWLGTVDGDYLICLALFGSTVVLYTTYGGFRAVVWTDVLQGALMVAGVVIMLVLVLNQVGGLNAATQDLARMMPPEHGEAVLRTREPVSEPLVVPKGAWIRSPSGDGSDLFRIGRTVRIEAGSALSEVVPVLRIVTPEEIERIEADPLSASVQVELRERRPYETGAGQRGVYLRAPGPDPNSDLGFLPLTMAISFFVFWAFGAAGQPSNMVRLMAFRNVAVFKRSIATVAIYYSAIYFPLVIIFCCARVVLPGMEIESDRVMPEMASRLTANAGWPWMAGLLMAAPFAAVMSSVDSFLLLVSSALVRDIYQRNINPQASEARLRRLTYGITCLVGMAAILGALKPPAYLQDLIIFSTSGLAACFLVPVLLGLYWPRMNAAGACAGMVAGCLTHLGLYIVGYWMEGRFTVYQALGFQPFVWDLLGSAVGAVAVALMTPPPKESLVRRFFARGT